MEKPIPMLIAGDVRLLSSHSGRDGVGLPLTLWLLFGHFIKDRFPL